MAILVTGSTGTIGSRVVANLAQQAGAPAMAVPQPVSAPLTRAAIFVVVTINPGPDNREAVRSFCADLPALIRAVEFRDLEAGLSCVMGIGSDAWDRLFGDPRPAELHPFREIRAGPRHAVTTGHRSNESRGPRRPLRPPRRGAP